MSRHKENGGYRLSPKVLIALWAIILMLLGLLGWREYHQARQHHEAMARQAVNVGVQVAVGYFKDITEQALLLARQESELLSHLLKNPQDKDSKQRLATAVSYRFPRFTALTLADPSGDVRLRIGPAAADSAFDTTNLNLPPLRVRAVEDEFEFDLSAPWYGQNKLQGTLWFSIGCEYFCRSLQAQAPEGHRLQLQFDAGPLTSSAGSISAPIPGTQWKIVNRVRADLLTGQLLETLLLSLILLALFIAVTLLLHSSYKRRNHATGNPDGHLREAFEASLVAHLLVDGNTGHIIDANQSAAVLFSHRKKQLQEKTLQQLLELDENLFQTYRETLQDAHQLCFDAPFTTSAGKRLELELQAAEIVDSGEAERLIIAATDVTNHRHSEHATQNNEEKLTAILNASSDGIVMTDANGIVQVFSPAAEMMFGYLKEEMLGRHFRLLIPECFAEGQNADLGSWIPEGLTALGAVRETAGMRKNGEAIPIRVSLNRVDMEDRLHFVALIQDLTEQQRNEKQLNYLERKDVLTGLLNRREFERRLDAMLSFSDQTEAEHALCYIDVDQFKVVNDTCGHVAGDELLKQLAILIKSHFKVSETIARLGGDEFGILLTDCSIERAEAFCTGLLQTVRNFLFTWRDQSFDVAVSIGLAGFRSHFENASQVLSEADVACHMAKRLGRDRLHIYHQGDSGLIRHHGDMHLVSAINKALNEGRFHLYAQPIVPVAAASRSHTHYEILVRMVDEHGHLVIPDHFIPAAERYILMPAIDRWVISRLFDTQGENLRRWARTHHEETGFLFGINLSGTSLTDDGFLNYLKRQFADFGVPYHTICFEITETAAVANLERAKTLIEELRELGCSFALDDFGTGLSSYSYLKVLPVDYLKIDGSFVRNMTKDPVDYAMVDSINQIGHILGLKTIAEWAENLNTLTQLRALNVDFAQGYGVGDMISVEEFRLPETTAAAPTTLALPNEPHRFSH